jgi:hypothetical protein
MEEKGLCVGLCVASGFDVRGGETRTHRVGMPRCQTVGMLDSVGNPGAVKSSSFTCVALFTHLPSHQDSVVDVSCFRRETG